MSTRKSATAAAPGPGSWVDVRAEVRRTHAAVLVFYVIDAVLLSILGASGTVARDLGLCYGLAGCAATEAIFFWFRRRGGRTADLDALSLWVTAAASVVMLATLAHAPPVGGLMLMSMMALLALSAVQLTRSRQLTLCALLAVGSVVILAARPGGVGVPTANAVERIVCTIWLALLMAKASAHNIAGTRLREQARKANAELARALQTLQALAATDELTNLPNRRGILACVDRAVAGGPQPGGRVGIALMDIDHFKRINDNHGHDIGDQVLRDFGRVAALGLRPTDQVGRYGGEEFLLVLQGIDDVGGAADVVERLCAGLAAHDWSRVAPGLAVTASAGVTLLLPGEDGASAIRRADAALYRAKEQGRNRVVAAAAPSSTT